MVIAYRGGKPDDELPPEVQAALTRWLERGGTIEFRAEDGRPLARFEPLAPVLTDDDPPLPDEEVERRLRESPRSTLADFWKRMGVA